MKIIHGLCVVLFVMNGYVCAMDGDDDWLAVHYDCNVVTSAEEERGKLEKDPNKESVGAKILKSQDGFVTDSKDQDQNNCDQEQKTNKDRIDEYFASLRPDNYDQEQMTNGMDEYLASLGPDLKKLAASITSRVPLLSSCFASGDASDDDDDGD